ncbi:hypothetical protein NQ314_004018 [Rhamnusium bicolor]|uniref:Major facilitator superfamily (MFS) profile domain-containing protein n=1 Tax=Rhamnusium bicolor TaxID=1586634 RepID=A0AAV8ZLR1_9CUCU|nr:hypothetical protein NQ314_004018 [Rhamnusium bicolor]
MVCAALPILFGLIFMMMPETPVFLLMKGRPESSKHSLRRLLGKTYIDIEFDEIQKYVQREIKIFSIKDILRKRSVKKAFVIGVGLAFIKILTGIDPITSYASQIFDNTDTLMGTKLAAIIFSTFPVFSIIPQALIIDRWGRKILLIISQFAMAFCLLATGLSLCLKSENSNNVLDYIPFVSLCLFMVGFSVGIGPIGWIITAEIFEEKIKGRATSVCTFLVWFLAFGNVKLFGVVESAWDISVPFFLYSCVSFIGAFFVLILVPETKNKTFDEIEKALCM